MNLETETLNQVHNLTIARNLLIAVTFGVFVIHCIFVSFIKRFER